MPDKPKGTVRGHKTTPAQQKLFGIARGIQKGDIPASKSPAAAKIAKSERPSDLHKMAQKPKGGFRKSP
jgi:hypothetical protein